MSLWSWIMSWFGPAPSIPAPRPSSPESHAESRPARAPVHEPGKRRPPRARARLVSLRNAKLRPQKSPSKPVTTKPYAFARPSVFGGFLDLTQDGDDGRLTAAGLPVFHTPQELANWLQLPLGQVAWLIHRFSEHQRPYELRDAHYHHRWIQKRSGGERLIEVPKPRLKMVQQRILREILAKVPPHPAAHGFVQNKSILTNAAPHLGQRVVLKLDLKNFYPTVTYSRVVAIFRSLGYCREAALWLARLTTSDLPESIQSQLHVAANHKWLPYRRRHLPQGACTSPALANLSAFALDLRLAGLTRKFGARYTRYADDLTFSGDESFLRSLAVFIPLASKVVRTERFHVNLKKRRVLRNNQRQSVTGVVTNVRANVARKDYDALKATLVNCLRRGPSTQNHAQHPNFAAYLEGRVAHVRMLNPERGQKLLDLLKQIDWLR